MVNQSNLENQTRDSDLVKCQDPKCSYRNPTQVTSADKVLVATMPMVLIMGRIAVTAIDITSDLKPLK